MLHTVFYATFVFAGPAFTWWLCFFRLPTPVDAAALAGLVVLALGLYKLPARTYEGPRTPGNDVPVYPDNGLVHIVFMTCLFFLGDGYGWWRADGFSCHVESWILPLNGAAIALCVVLHVTGMRYGVSPDNGPVSDSALRNFYAGVWLHPRALGVDLKMFVNSRLSMTLWFVHSASSVLVGARRGDWGLGLCAASQLLYLVNFFLRESHYAFTIDIIEDRAGFYETWGCLAWVPAVYTLHTRLALRHGSGVPPAVALSTFAVGAVAWFFNQWTNEQRRLFRAQPTRPLFGKKRPPRFIVAKYTVQGADVEDVTRSSFLLVDGWWGWVRHPQYIFDIVHAWSWALLAGGTGRNPLAFFYPVYITVLLLHRATRDHERCTAKYGEYYREYCRHVPYMVLPGVF